MSDKTDVPGIGGTKFWLNFEEYQFELAFREKQYKKWEEEWQWNWHYNNRDNGTAGKYKRG